MICTLHRLVFPADQSTDEVLVAQTMPKCRRSDFTLHRKVMHANWKSASALPIAKNTIYKTALKARLSQLFVAEIKMAHACLLSEAIW